MSSNQKLRGNTMDTIHTHRLQLFIETQMRPETGGLLEARGQYRDRRLAREIVGPTRAKVLIHV